MLNYTLRRVGYIVFVFLIISIIMFGIFKAVPADPVMMYLEGRQQEMSPADFQRLYDNTRESMGLDDPLYVQYYRWMGKMLRGDFGRSLVSRRPVINVVQSPLVQTIKLNVITMIFVFVITIPLGISTAVRKGSVYDNSVQVVTILGYSIPVFIIALVAIFLFSVILNWLPIGGSATPNFQGTGFAAMLDAAKYMVLPVVVMTFTSLGSLTRYIRAAMIDALRMDYIRTARAKGLKEKVVIYSHAFRNSMIPFVTALIGWLLSMFSGSVVIETMFGWNGMGRLLVSSIMALDYQVALCLQMFYVLISLVGNLIVDIAYTLVDPRVRFS